MEHPRTIEDITAPWVTAVLRGTGVLRQSAVRAVDVRAVGQGVGLLSNRARVTLTYDVAEAGAPATVVIKMPATVKEGAEFAESTHVYEREIRFYREVAPRTSIRVPRLYAAIMEPTEGVFILIPEDPGSARAPRRDLARCRHALPRRSRRPAAVQPQVGMVAGSATTGAGRHGLRSRLAGPDFAGALVAGALVSRGAALVRRCRPRAVLPS